MTSDRTGRIAKNTLLLYVRMLLAMVIGFYTSRIILTELGVSDFGIYEVVGGLVGMFGVLNISMANTTSRFITVAIGKNDLADLRQVFSTALTIHLLLGILFVLLAEPVGLWFLKQKMQIEPERIGAAIWVFHCTVAASFFSIVNVPYSAMIISYERINIYAYFSLIDLFLRLGAVLLLPYYAIDKLKLYAVLLLAVQISMQLIYWQYCFRNFQESHGGPTWKKARFKTMSSFAGWSLFGDSSVLMFSQGINILLNIFFGSTVNAARGLAMQAQSVVSRFIGSFQTAINPQLVKSYAKGDYTYMHKLLYASSKFSFFLFLLLAIPVFFEAHQLLFLWLKIVPEYTVTFLRIILFISLLDCLANPLIISVKATGKIKKYQTILGSLLLSVVPISYLFLKLGFPPESVFFVHFCVALTGQWVRVVLARSLIGLSLGDYASKIVLRCVVGLLLVSVIPGMIYFAFDESLGRLFAISVTTVLCILVVVYFFVSGRDEKKWIMERLRLKVIRL